MANSNERAIFQEMEKIGSEAVVNSNPIKQAAALSILSGALSMEDSAKALRLLALARNISRSGNKE